MASLVNAPTVGRLLLEALGLDLPLVTRVTLDLAAGDLARVTIERIVTVEEAGQLVEVLRREGYRLTQETDAESPQGANPGGEEGGEG